MPTLLARKANSEKPVATNDDHHEALASDPGISAFPTGSSFGTVSTTTTQSTTSSFGSTPLGGNTMSAMSAPSGFGASSMPAQSNANNVQVVQNQAESLKSGGGAMSEGGESTVKLDKDATDWINKKMRPMMGWIYMLTCTADFVIFPVLWSLLQALSHGQVTSQWQPLTLQGAGLYHIAMGAVLGIAAYGRTKEKVAGVAS
jgi:hypothetical protein